MAYLFRIYNDDITKQVIINRLIHRILKGISDFLVLFQLLGKTILAGIQ